MVRARGRGVRLLVGVTLLVGGGGTAQADPGRIYVDAEAEPEGDGSSWTTAFTTVQDALAVARPGDAIWVAEGVYYPDEGGGQTDGDRLASFTLSPGVAVYGGFPTGAGDGTLGARDWETYVTVLSGDIDGDDITDAYGVVTDTANIVGDNAYHVVLGGGVTETAVLGGFAVTGGRFGCDWPDDRGSGMWNVASSPTLVDLSFSGNQALNTGGGMYNYKGSPKLTNVTLSGNQAGTGGGMCNFDSSPTLTNVAFTGNSADQGVEEGDGGGMHNYPTSSPVLTNVTFISNTATVDGGGWRTGAAATRSSPT